MLHSRTAAGGARCALHEHCHFGELARAAGDADQNRSLGTSRLLPEVGTQPTYAARVEVVSFVLNAGAICIVIVLVIGGLIVGLPAALTFFVRQRGRLDGERADRSYRIRAVVLIVLGVLCLLAPVQRIVTGQGLVAGSVGVIAAGGIMTAGGLIGHSFFTQRIEGRRR